MFIVLLQNAPRGIDENIKLIKRTGTDTNSDGVSETIQLITANLSLS